MEVPVNEQEISLSKEEIEMFEHFANMETVHNEIARVLALYKESIIQNRNSFVDSICSKYHIKNRRHLCYDSVGKRLVSIFHPNVQASRILREPAQFEHLASNMVLKVIKELSTAIKQIRS